jgi:hypothetical protein
LPLHWHAESSATNESAVFSTGKFCLRSNLRHDHQIAAVNTKHTPSGSGTKNAPKAASAVGDLIFRSSIVFTACLREGRKAGSLTNR